MKPTTDNTRHLFQHLRTAAALASVMLNDLDGNDRRQSFDMGVPAAADLLDAIGREAEAFMEEADRFECVNNDQSGAWPETLPERLLFREKVPVPVVPVDTIGILGARVRSVARVTAAALRQCDVYVYATDVHDTLDALSGMLAELAVVLEHVDIDAVACEGSIYRPGAGPSRAWPGEQTAEPA